MKADVERYIKRRKRADKAFAKDFEAGYEQFKIGVMLRQAREQAGVSQARKSKVQSPRSKVQGPKWGRSG